MKIVSKTKGVALFQMGDGVRQIAPLYESTATGFHPIAVAQLVSTNPGDEYELGSVGPVILRQQVQKLEGKLLTILDASLPEGQQLKAMKDLVSNGIHGWYQYEISVAAVWTQKLIK